MRISTKGRYALRLMLDLAEHQGDGCVSLKDVAQRQDISKKYLEQIVPTLSRAGFLLTNRGYQGGYRLARRPEDYTARDILRLTEGSLAPVACLDCEVNTCPRSANCPTLPLWQGLDRCDRGLSRGRHAAGSDRPPARAQRRRLCDLKKVGGCHRQPPTL